MMDPALNARGEKAWLVSVLHLAGTRVFHAVSKRDMGVDEAWIGAQLDRMGLVPKRPVHLIASGPDWTRIWPLEAALIRRSIPSTGIEPGAFDYPRAEMFLRRMPAQAVIGLHEGHVKGIAALGKDLKTLLAPVPVIVGTPDGVPLLRDLGFKPWCLAMVGPLVTVAGPADEGAVYNTDEWHIDARDGLLHVTTKGARFMPMVRVNTGVKGRVERVGSEPRVFLA